MTIHEAMDRGITAVTQEPWKSGNKYCRMELPPLLAVPSEAAARGVKGYGLWGKLIDPCGNLALGQDSEKPIDVLLIAGDFRQPAANPTKDEWEEWMEPADYSRLGKRWTWADSLAPAKEPR